MAFTLTADQEVALALEAVDDHGNPVAGTSLQPTWSVSDASILTLTDNGDGTALLASVGPDGNAQVSVTDAVSGLGGVLDVVVVSGNAAAIAIVPGVPQAKP
jgi:hypothetical protein